jgi:hypothetical protein
MSRPTKKIRDLSVPVPEVPTQDLIGRGGDSSSFVDETEAVFRSREEERIAAFHQLLGFDGSPKRSGFVWNYIAYIVPASTTSKGSLIACRVFCSLNMVD